MGRTIGDDLAFPILDRQNLKGGLTKREEFAKTAMQGILASGKMSSLNTDSTKEEIDFVAAKSVGHADALIEELNKAE